MLYLLGYQFFVVVCDGACGICLRIAVRNVTRDAFMSTECSYFCFAPDFCHIRLFRRGGGVASNLMGGWARDASACGSDLLLLLGVGCCTVRCRTSLLKL